MINDKSDSQKVRYKFENGCSKEALRVISV
jgi:hypothetical protein